MNSLATATGFSEEKGVYISSSAEDAELKEKLVADLKAAQITIPEPIAKDESETQKEWMERKCMSARVFLVVLSNEYEKDGNCKEEADTAQLLTRKMIFAKAKSFRANAWMKNIAKDKRIFDLTNEEKYKKNLTSLIDSVKLGTEIIFPNCIV